MSGIQVLPPEVVNQIAAGEVVERPFSVVKELVENSLDAGATRVHIELEEGGRALIRITDDGSGFSESDLELAFVSHATSKLRASADLDHIASLGFRGEALASIGSIARTWIRSRPTGADGGHEVRCEGGTISAVKPCGCPPGSILEIRDLFYNVPARRQFLKAPHAERARIQEALLKVALAHLDVDFTLVADGRTVLRLEGGQSLQERVNAAFGKKLSGDWLTVESTSSDGYSVRGLAIDPDGARRDGRLELLYINGRCAKDRSSGAAIRQAYRPYLIHGRYPAYVLLLSLPPDQVDVNVHPTKAEVRFVRPRQAAGLLHDAVRQALEQRGATRVAKDSQGGAVAGSSTGPGRPAAVSGFPDLPKDLFGRSGADSSVTGGRPAAPRAGDDLIVREPKAESSAPTLPGIAIPSADEVGSSALSSPVDERSAPEGGASHPFADLAASRFVQVLDLYLVFGTERGMVVVDQHALHERVMYEQLLAQHAERGTQVQRLLVPEVLDVLPTDKAYLLSIAGELEAVGFLLEDFGGDAVAVHGVPALLGRLSARKLVERFLLGDGDEHARPAAGAAVAEKFHSIACRSSVMSGDRLSDDEIASLLAAASKLNHPHHCPHGRPTVLSFESAELERYFRRRT